VLVALVVLSFAVFFFFYRNLRNVHRDLGRIRQAADLSRVGNRNMEQFVLRLVDYSHTHPDFLPILARYGVVKPGPAPTTGLTNPPAAAPPQQKK
jgi:hypothetical protein